MTSIAFLSVFFVGLLVSRSIQGSPPLEVVFLTDANFEHDTQAASGQTTGKWCVLFTSPKQRAEHQAAMAVWSLLAEDEGKEVIYAVVDVDANKKLARRFKDIAIPSAVLLRNRAMYTYSVPDSPDCHEHISGFVSSGYTLVPRQAVPKESAGAVPDAQEASFNFLGLNKSQLMTVAFVLALSVVIFLSSIPKAQETIKKPSENSATPSAKATKKPTSDAGQKGAGQQANAKDGGGKRAKDGKKLS